MPPDCREFGHSGRTFSDRACNLETLAATLAGSGLGRCRQASSTECPLPSRWARAHPAGPILPAICVFSTSSLQSGNLVFSSRYGTAGREVGRGCAHDLEDVVVSRLPNHALPTLGHPRTPAAPLAGLTSSGRQLTLRGWWTIAAPCAGACRLTCLALGEPLWDFGAASAWAHQIPEALRLRRSPNSSAAPLRTQLPRRCESPVAPDAARIENSRQGHCQPTRSLPAANSRPIEYSTTRMMSEQF